MPLCDGTCVACKGAGEIEKVFPKRQGPHLPDTSDGDLVRQLCDKEDLSDWETNFCVSVERQVAAGGTLSPKQVSKIRQILGER